MVFKILVVSDSVSDKNLIKNTLSDYCVFTASNSSEAWSNLKKHQGINLVIYDVNCMDYSLFLDSLMFDENFKNLKVIIVTDNDFESKSKALTMGAIDYIRKPLHAGALQARIKLYYALLEAENQLSNQTDELVVTFEKIFDEAPIGISVNYSCDVEGTERKIMKINKRFQEIVGYSKEDIISLGWEKITHPDDIAEDLHKLAQLRAGEINMYTMDKRYIRPDGSLVWVHMIIAPLKSECGQPMSYICLVQDITEKKEMEKLLSESERSKSVFLSHLPGLAYRCNNDSDWTMQYVSQGCYNLTGYKPESLLYNSEISFNEIIAPEYRDLLTQEWERILPKRAPFKYEYEIITATGERKWVLEMGQGVYNEQGEVIALEGLVLDISERKAVEDTLKYNTEHEPLTDLYNRKYLVDVLEKDLKQKKDTKKALIGINLSMVQLLAVNYGYHYVQSLMKRAAEKLKKHCQDKCILFHPRENSFVFYLWDYQEKCELVNFCNEIVKTLESFLITERIGFGMGVLEIDDSKDNTDIDMLLRKLLIASERSINLIGKDYEIIFYDENLEAVVNRERDIVDILKSIAAGEETNDKLFLHYQPIIDLETGAVFGFEALARLYTEKYGMVSPMEFIPIAEMSKLILPLGDKIIIQAFAFLNKLNQLGYKDVSVSINISVIQLLKPDFTSKLMKLIKSMKINPKNIGIEITETLFAEDSESINRIVEVLRSNGVYIAIDDFGTGYSSLAREQRIHVDCMKIDKYFVDKLLDPDLRKQITCDIISMSHKLGHCTIAEGVEHHTQLQYLKEHKCDKIQGYLISKPLSEEDAISFLEKYDSNLIFKLLNQ